MSLRSRRRVHFCGSRRPRRQLGFFIPCRNATRVHRAGRSGYPALEGIFKAATPRFLDHLACIDSLADALLAIGTAGTPPQPRWLQDWFPRLDAAAAYAMMRTRRPARLVEIGCGHSTRFFCRAVADAGLDTRIIAVDPAPRANLRGLPVEHRARSVQAVRAAAVDGFAAGDVVSLDGSHVLMPGSDVDLVLNDVLPRLPGGACVHLHDIFLPDPYPARWTWRGYNEQSAVAGLLQGGAWQLLWSSRWVATRMPDAVARSVAGCLPLPPGAWESSIWLEKL